MSLIYVTGYDDNGDIVNAYPVQRVTRISRLTVRKAKKLLKCQGSVRITKSRVHVTIH